LKGWTGADGVEEPLPVDELPRFGSADGVVRVDVRVPNEPARGRERAGVVDLPRDGFRVGVGTVLLGDFLA
jgi:hypothetical protein